MAQTDASATSQDVVDFDLAVRIERALHATGYGGLRDVRACVRGGAVTLKGQVPSYHLKQVAQATAQAIVRAHLVRNDLAVARPN